MKNARFHAREAIRNWRLARVTQNEARRLVGDISYLDALECLIWRPEPKLENRLRVVRERNRGL